MICRKSVAAMISANEAEAYVDAVLQLKDPNISPSIIAQAQNEGATSRYDDYVWMHKAAFSLIHLGPSFGPWHREILRQFELDLRDVASDDTLYVPYWDWPNGNSSNDAGWPFVDALMGGLGVQNSNWEVATGRFAGATGDWPINVRDNNHNHIVLRRASTTDPNSLSIPSHTRTRTALAAEPYDSAQFNDTVGTFPTTAVAAISFRKSLEYFLHNGPHNWVGAERDQFGALVAALDMLARSSPNDPIFFLHHAGIDRIWQIWQERQGAVNNLAPGDTFEPDSGANNGHNLLEVMDITDQAFFNWPVLDTNVSNLDLHATGVWYDTDVPVVSVTTPSVNFGTIPAGMTTYKPVQFSVEGCRSLQFRITGVSAGAYSIPPGNANLTIAASEVPDARMAELFLACTAPNDGSAVGAGAATIEAYVVDADGYLTGNINNDFVIETFSITLNATIEPRMTTAVAFVSDRSGSMVDPAGSGLTKFDLLEEALEVATDLLDSNDSTALVFFDASVSIPLSISAVGNGNAVQTALNDPSIQPNFGATGIGSGLIAGATELNNYVLPVDVVNPNYAIVCLTDGNQNRTPNVESAQVTNALAAYSNELYAIGLGTEDNVSADTLGAISNYMMITGEIDADIRRFMLTKYFVQIIADVKKASIIVDPEGTLYPGIVHEVHFDVTEADVSFDVVVLSMFARFIDVEVVTPGGDVLSGRALGPNASLRSNRLDSIFRIGLPALPGTAATSHAGRWTVRLGLVQGKGHTDKLLATRLLAAMTSASSEAGSGVPYNVLIQTRSNLSMSIGSDIPRVLIGDKLSLALSLSQYGVALNSAHVNVTVTDPHGHTQVHTLNQKDGNNTFVGSIQAPLKGVYSCRINASGTSMGGRHFTREATRTFGVGRPVTVQTPGPSNQSGDLCGVLACFLKDKAIRKSLESKGVDLVKLQKCLRTVCDDSELPDEHDSDESCKKEVKHFSEPGTPAQGIQPQQLLQLMRMVGLTETDRGVASEFPPVVPVKVAEVDPALFDKPMFMPVMAWDEDGEAVKVFDGMDMGGTDDESEHDMDKTKDS